ncbi:hypothetical protein A9Q99_04900 [Gammaproteobacteria bacterium 45_16_T64]|nr:hypothetical protein A9Q99_04900 [Gammaproteobacteria bacterium 45_16_T64]
MSKYSKNSGVSEQTKEESLKLAKGIQKPGQTKEQTKLIAQGIQKGMDIYKKQHKAKLREQSKTNRKHARSEPEQENTASVKPNRKQTLPWILLTISWGAFLAYVLLNQ